MKWVRFRYIVLAAVLTVGCVTSGGGGSHEDLMVALEGSYDNARQADGGAIDLRQVEFGRRPSPAGFPNNSLGVSWRNGKGLLRASETWTFSTQVDRVHLVIEDATGACTLTVAVTGRAAFDARTGENGCAGPDGRRRALRITLMPTGLLYEQAELASVADGGGQVARAQPYDFRKK